MNIEAPSQKVIIPVPIPHIRLKGVYLPLQKRAESAACVTDMETSASQKFILFEAVLTGDERDFVRKTPISARDSFIAAMTDDVTAISSMYFPQSLKRNIRTHMSRYGKVSSISISPVIL